jgi:hypothetical protein
VVDVALELDLATAAASDDVADTVHYGELAERLAAVIAGEPVNLIETLADRLLAVCLADAGSRRHGHRAQAAGADPARVRRRGRHAARRRRDPGVLSIGSNLGDRYAHLRRRSTARRERGVVSGVYETPPWGDTDQPPYLNAVVLGWIRGPTARLAGPGPRRRDAAGRVRDPAGGSGRARWTST